jgi:hypothetical protein
LAWYARVIPSQRGDSQLTSIEAFLLIFFSLVTCRQLRGDLNHSLNMID